MVKKLGESSDGCRLHKLQGPVKMKMWAPRSKVAKNFKTEKAER